MKSVNFDNQILFCNFDSNVKFELDKIDDLNGKDYIYIKDSYIDVLSMDNNTIKSLVLINTKCNTLISTNKIDTIYLDCSSYILEIKSKGKVSVKKFLNPVEDMINKNYVEFNNIEESDINSIKKEKRKLFTDMTKLVDYSIVLSIINNINFIENELVDYDSVIDQLSSYVKEYVKCGICFIPCLNKTKCNHFYCSACLKKWLDHCLNNNLDKTCPSCREKLE